MNLEYFLHIFIMLLPQWLDEWQMIMLALMVLIFVKQKLSFRPFLLYKVPIGSILMSCYKGKGTLQFY